MPSLYARIPSKISRLFVLTLLAVVAVNLTAAMMLFSAGTGYAQTFPRFRMIVVIFILQLPLLYDAVRIWLKKSTSAFGIYLVIMSTHVAVVLGVLGLLLVTILLGWEYALATLAISGIFGSAYILAFTVSGYGFPALIYIQPLIWWLMAPWLPRFIRRTTDSVSIPKGNSLPARLKRSRFRHLIHPDLDNLTYAIIFIVAVFAYAVVGFGYFVVGPTFFVPREDFL